MSHGPVSQFSISIASGVTLTSSISLGTRAWKTVYVSIPTMVSGSDFFIQGSGDDSTYRRIIHPIVNSSSVQANTFIIGSGATNKIVPIPNGFAFIKVELSTAMTDTTSTFKIICSD